MLLWILPTILVLFLTGCASSAVSRDVSSNVDQGVQNAGNLYEGTTSGNIADTYQNSSQASKGAIIGGVGGAMVGTFSSGVGLIPGTIIGTAAGASYGSYIDANTTLRDRLDNRGATIVTLGDQILIVIPSDRLFNPLTASVKPQAYSTIELLAQYINQYTKTLVKVSAFTPVTGSPRAEMVLSKMQAENIAKLLFASGVDARILYAEGYGGTHLVVPTSLSWGESDNYRIEITLEKLYV